MDSLDLNLLVALDALLDTHSVTAAARRLHTSSSAMSRTLTKLRAALNDPLLVRSGRALVPTPRALELRHEVAAVVERARALLAGAEDGAVGRSRDFVVRVADAVASRLVGPLLPALAAALPGATVRLLPESADTAAALRDGRVDIEIGVPGRGDPETVVQRLFGDELVGVADAGHPFVTARPTVAAFASARHVEISPHGRVHGPIDDRLALHGRTRRVTATVPDLAAALFAVRGSDLVCPVPARLSRPAREALGLGVFAIPLPLPPIPLAMSWHPRHTADPTHRRLRELLADTLSEDQASGDLVPA
ncbi:LysR family transcriptional regulator [Nocardia thailandica]|uniref:LysR family transcriptional regulator n=1 Tax=Nocardia thailandica TaxID=257275 RepID=A0ABW6PQB9_9NOCA|nr:LysR family transcriptional regulator [Nocardia thailandica]